MRAVAPFALLSLAACATTPFDGVAPLSVEVPVSLDGTCGGELPAHTDARGTTRGDSRLDDGACHVRLAWEGVLLTSDELRAAVDPTSSVDDDVTFLGARVAFLGAEVPGQAGPAQLSARIDVVGDGDLAVDGVTLRDAYPLITVTADDGTAGLAPSDDVALAEGLASWVTLVYREHVDLLGSAEIELRVPEAELDRFAGYDATLVLGIELSLEGEARGRGE